MVLALVLGRVVEKRESDEEEKKVAGERETTTIAAVALQDKYNRGRAENWERKRRKSTRRRGGEEEEEEDRDTEHKINTNCWLNLASSSLARSRSISP